MDSAISHRKIFLGALAFGLGGFSVLICCAVLADTSQPSSLTAPAASGTTAFMGEVLSDEGWEEVDREFLKAVRSVNVSSEIPREDLAEAICEQSLNAEQLTASETESSFHEFAQKEKALKTHLRGLPRAEFNRASNAESEAMAIEMGTLGMRLKKEKRLSPDDLKRYEKLQDILVVWNFRLIARYVHLHLAMYGRSTGNIYFDEWLAVAVDAYVAALRDFNPEYGFKLSTFSSTVMLHALGNWMKTARWRRLYSKMNSIHEPAPGHDGRKKGLELADALIHFKGLHSHIPSPSQHLIQKEERSAFTEACKEVADHLKQKQQQTRNAKMIKGFKVQLRILQDRICEPTGETHDALAERLEANMGYEGTSGNISNLERKLYRMLEIKMRIKLGLPLSSPVSSPVSSDEPNVPNENDEPEGDATRADGGPARAPARPKFNRGEALRAEAELVARLEPHLGRVSELYEFCRHKLQAQGLTDAQAARELERRRLVIEHHFYGEKLSIEEVASRYLQETRTYLAQVEKALKPEIQAWLDALESSK